MKRYKRPQMAYMIGAVLVWAGLFAATVLRLGGTPHFGEMLPILFGSAVYFIVIVPQGLLRSIAQPSQPHARSNSPVRRSIKVYEQPRVAYLIGTVLVWAGLFAATVLLLGGTPHFGEMLPILFLGAVYFIVIVPQGFRRAIAQSGRPHTP